MQPHDTTPTKVCTKCGEAKPATTEYFNADKRYKFGVHSQCKSCVAAYCRARYAADKERQAAATRAWRVANPEKWREIGRAYRETHRDEMKEKARVYAQTRGKERIARYGKAYRDANRERRKMWARADRDAKREMYRAKDERRRASKMKAEGTHTGDDIKAQYKRQKGRCYWCGEKVGDTYHVDHIVPLSRGGSNWPDNLVVSCPFCNTSKGDRLPHEWSRGGRLL